MNIPDYIETTPAAITLKQGGTNWLISTSNGLINLYKAHTRDFVPITVFVRARDGVRAQVLWMHPNGGYLGSEF